MNNRVSMVLAAMLGGLIGLLITLKMSPNFWWLGMIGGALSAGAAYNPQEVVSVVRSAWREHAPTLAALLAGIPGIIASCSRIVGYLVISLLFAIWVSGSLFGGLAVVLGIPVVAIQDPSLAGYSLLAYYGTVAFASYIVLAGYTLGNDLGTTTIHKWSWRLFPITMTVGPLLIVLLLPIVAGTGMVYVLYACCTIWRANVIQAFHELTRFVGQVLTYLNTHRRLTAMMGAALGTAAGYFTGIGLVGIITCMIVSAGSAWLMCEVIERAATRRVVAS